MKFYEIREAISEHLNPTAQEWFDNATEDQTNDFVFAVHNGVKEAVRIMVEMQADIINSIQGGDDDA